ncbi:MAG: PAS domain-containing protein, partial [Methylococcales bacterium]|nr:PAS domain-containing protein [Methylococcales bacterium]
MNMQPDKADLTRKLRQQTEESALKNENPLLENLKTMSPQAIGQILYDLHVHQTELEMQNDELRRTQEELDAIKSRYFDLYDLAPVGYCTLSAQGRILEANLKAANLLGVTRMELVGRPFHFFILHPDRDIFYLYRKKLDNTGGPQDCELRMVKADGTSFWVYLTTTSAMNKDGASELRIILSDITSDKLAEAALQESKEKYRRLAEDMPMFISTFLPDGTLTYANAALTNLVALTPEQLSR